MLHVMFRLLGIMNSEIPYRNHWCVQPIHGLVPAETAQREFAGDVIRQCPLRQIHDVRRLVDSDDTVHRAGGQQQALVLGAEFDISHTGPGIDEIRTANPTFDRSHCWRRLLANRFLPNGHGAIERASGEHLAEFRMRPRQSPHRAGVRLPAGRNRPDAFLVLVPNLVKDSYRINMILSFTPPNYLHRLVTGTGGHSLAMIIINHIMNHILVLSPDYLRLEHVDLRLPYLYKSP